MGTCEADAHGMPPIVGAFTTLLWRSFTSRQESHLNANSVDNDGLAWRL